MARTSEAHACTCLGLVGRTYVYESKRSVKQRIRNISINRSELPDPVSDLGALFAAQLLVQILDSVDDTMLVRKVRGERRECE